jgi:hypothetical protein
MLMDKPVAGEPFPWVPNNIDNKQRRLSHSEEILGPGSQTPVPSHPAVVPSGQSGISGPTIRTGLLRSRPGNGSCRTTFPPLPHDLAGAVPLLSAIDARYQSLSASTTRKPSNVRRTADAGTAARLKNRCRAHDILCLSW